MNADGNEIARVLEQCSILEIAIEVIEKGSAGVVDRLKELEPIPMQFLLDEGVRRLGGGSYSEYEFLDKLLSASSPLDPDVQVVLRHAIKAKEIERRFGRRVDR